jgi:hypothetical protein
MPAPTRLFMSFLPMTLLVADTTSVLRLFLVKLPGTVNIPIVPTCLVHLIAQSLFLPPSDTQFPLLVIWDVVRTIVLRPMCLVVDG